MLHVESFTKLIFLQTLVVVATVEEHNLATVQDMKWVFLWALLDRWGRLWRS